MSKNENKKGISSLVSILVMRKRSHRLSEVEINFISVSFCKFPNFRSFSVFLIYSSSTRARGLEKPKLKIQNNYILIIMFCS